jgi:4'-phosphopantetheinyl transferase
VAGLVSFGSRLVNRPWPSLDRSMDLPRERVDLWFVHLPSGSCAPLRADGWLSAEERQAAAALSRPAARLLRIVGYSARRAVLSLYLSQHPWAWQFFTGTHGRPELVPIPGVPCVSTSVSHTEGMVVIGVTKAGLLGVDVERIDRRRRALEIARRCFDPEEVAALQALPVEMRHGFFAALWSLKESYLKARGVGIWGGIDLGACRFDIRGDAEEQILFHPGRNTHDRAGQWRFFLFRPIADYCAAVAVRSRKMHSLRLATFSLSEDLRSFRCVSMPDHRRSKTDPSTTGLPHHRDLPTWE